MKTLDDSIIVVGGGLAGTLVSLELERRAIPFQLFDVGKGEQASRVAAGLLNPLIGPRLSVPDFDWSVLQPFYREIEHRLHSFDNSVPNFFHSVPLFRPGSSLKIQNNTSLRMQGSGWEAKKIAFEPPPGWKTMLSQSAWEISGAGWLNIPALIDAAHQRFAALDCLQTRWADSQELRNHPKPVIWCEGASIFDHNAKVENHPWAEKPWQAVKGELLTLHVPDLDFAGMWVAEYFLLALGAGKFRVGATHEPDCANQITSATGRVELEAFVSNLIDAPYEVIDHRAGIRPASRHYLPFVEQHPMQKQWFLFNGFAGRGASRIPAMLPRLMELIGV